MSRQNVLPHPGACDHLVQFCGDESTLAQSVGTYLREGAAAGERMIVIATADHVRLFTENLQQSGVDAAALVRDGRLQVLDAAQTLSKIMVGREPDADRFDEIVGTLVRSTREAARLGGLRAYGEMVNLLWKEGNLRAATRLEELWNQLLKVEPFALFCAYTVDLLSGTSRGADLHQVLSTHTRLLPVCSNGELDRAVNRALNKVLGESTVAALMPLVRANVVSRVLLPDAERTVLWLLRNIPPFAGEVLARARIYYQEEWEKKHASVRL